MAEAVYVANQNINSIHLEIIKSALKYRKLTEISRKIPHLSQNYQLQLLQIN